MATWADQGHAMRRRSGNPSSHTESTGPAESRQHETLEEQYNSAAGVASPRTALGRDGHEAAEPAGVEYAEDRSGSERNGAQYRVTAGAATVDPTVGPTPANGRIVPQFPGQSLNFQAAIQSSEF